MLGEQFCQSCGMPMPGKELMGTEENGDKCEDYCVFCYEKGAFKQPGITMEQMIETCLPFITKSGLSEEKARYMLNDHLPKLKRWRRVVN